MNSKRMTAIALVTASILPLGFAYAGYGDPGGGGEPGGGPPGGISIWPDGHGGAGSEIRGGDLGGPRCGPAGSSTTSGVHGYILDTAGTVSDVYNDCEDPTSPSNALTGADDEWAAGIDGAAFNSANDVVGVNDPSNDLVAGVNADPYTSVNPANVGGVNNCVGAPFTAHHGGDEFINTADAVEGGNIRVFVTADNHDGPGERAYNAILTENGGVWPAGVDDPRDPCGDDVIDATDLSAVSEPCGTTPALASGSGDIGITSANCSVNAWDSGRTLAEVAGLDGNIWTMIAISTGNVSVATIGSTWTSVVAPGTNPDSCLGLSATTGASYECAGYYAGERACAGSYQREESGETCLARTR